MHPRLEGNLPRGYLAKLAKYLSHIKGIARKSWLNRLGAPTFWLNPGEGRKFPSFPSHCLNYSNGPPVASNGLSCTHEIAYVTKISFRGTYNSIFWNDSFYITRNDYLVSSEPPRRNPYLKAVDYVIHGKLRDSWKTTWLTENYVIHRAPVETT